MYSFYRSTIHNPRRLSYTTSHLQKLIGWVQISHLSRQNPNMNVPTPFGYQQGKHTLQELIVTRWICFSVVHSIEIAEKALLLSCRHRNNRSRSQLPVARLWIRATSPTTTLGSTETGAMTAKVKLRLAALLPVLKVPLVQTRSTSEAPHHPSNSNRYHFCVDRTMITRLND